MRWFWLWRLRVANDRLRNALDGLPNGWHVDPENHVEEIVEWSRAHMQVTRLLEKLS